MPGGQISALPSWGQDVHNFLFADDPGINDDNRVYEGLNSSPVACQKPIARYDGRRSCTTSAASIRFVRKRIRPSICRSRRLPYW